MMISVVSEAATETAPKMSHRLAPSPEEKDLFKANRIAIDAKGTVLISSNSLLYSETKDQYRELVDYLFV
jgi:hypothetical protein